MSRNRGDVSPDGRPDGRPPADPAEQTEPELPEDKKKKGKPVPKFTAGDFEYDINEFLCAGQDDRGNSMRLFFRCPPLMERDLEVLRDSKRFPYRTVSDIVRHAVYRHIHWLHALEREIPQHFMSGLDGVMEVTRDHEMRAGMESTFQKLDQMIDAALAVADTMEALRLMTTARNKIVKLPDTRWKKRWLEKFSRKYGHHFTGAPAPAPGEQAATQSLIEEEED